LWPLNKRVWHITDNNRGAALRADLVANTPEIDGVIS
jgi:hypothetical protein